MGKSKNSGVKEVSPVLPADKTRYRSTFYWQGKRYEATSSKSQRDADKKAALKKDKLNRGEIGISSKMTVKCWAETWLETYKKNVLAEKQYKDYEGMVNNTIIPAIGSLRLSDVKDTHLQKIINSKAGQSLDRLNKLNHRINAMFRQAQISGLIVQNPAQFLTIPKAEDGTHRSITPFEREHFLKAAETHYAGLMFKVMLFCGLRTGEVVALDWRDIDFDKRRIKVNHAMESGTDNIKGPKSAAGVREIPIPNEIYNDLLMLKGDPFSPVFTRPNNQGRYTNMSRHRAWLSFKEQMDISMGAKFETVTNPKTKRKRKIKTLSVVADDLVPYCLRHTYCTDLQDKGVPINVAKYLMGHANIAITAKIYTHISDVAIESAAALINGDGGKDGGNEKYNA